MKPEIQLVVEKLVVLYRIKKQVLYNNTDDVVTYSYISYFNGRYVPPENELKVLKMLEAEKAFSILSAPDENASLGDENPFQIKPNIKSINQLVTYYNEIFQKSKIDDGVTDTVTISITKEGQKVYLTVAGKPRQLLNNLQKDRAPEVLINFLMNNPGQTFYLNNLKSEEHLGALASTNNLGEVIRFVGFNKVLKRFFFPICTSNKVMFNKNIEVTIPDSEVILDQLPER